MQKIQRHFKKVDPALYAAIDGDTWYTLRRRHDRFTGLCRIIVGQQLSTKAARSIFERFRTLFPKNKPTPEGLLTLGEKELRAAGLSGQKVKYLRDLAERVQTNTLPLRALHNRPDDEVIAHITAVHGLGRWSAEMFLIFYLGREDIFSPGDLGLRNAIKKLYNKRTVPTEKQAERIAKKWSPYRSYACRILWHSLDNEPK